MKLNPADRLHINSRIRASRKKLAERQRSDGDRTARRSDRLVRLEVAAERL